MKTMGDRIKRLRTDRNWTQDELGRMIGAGDKYISALENGRRKPGPKLMTELCNAFGVTEQEIRFGDADETDNRQAPFLRMLIDELKVLPDTEQLEWILKIRRWKEEETQARFCGALIDSK